MGFRGLKGLLGGYVFNMGFRGLKGLLWGLGVKGSGGKGGRDGLY